MLLLYGLILCELNVLFFISTSVRDDIRVCLSESWTMRIYVLGRVFFFLFMSSDSIIERLFDCMGNFAIVTVGIPSEER